LTEEEIDALFYNENGDYYYEDLWSDDEWYFDGGFPSTHTTVVTSTIMLIGFTEGFSTPIFGLGVAFLYITIIDATGIRRTVGKHATVINEKLFDKERVLRERQGHNLVEVLGGIALGSLVGFLISLLVNSGFIG
jgi:uncharacterized protein